MSVGAARVHRFDECCVCLENANTIGNGGEFRAIGHIPAPRTVGEQAECVHAICLPCIQREDAGLARRTQSKLLSACQICRSPFIDGEPNSEENRRRVDNHQPPKVQRLEFTVRPAAVMVDGVHSNDEYGQPAYIGEVTKVETVAQERINNVRERSNIEINAEAIGRELGGRVVSFVIGAIGGFAVGMALHGFYAMVKNAAAPEFDLFIPKEGLGGNSSGFIFILVGGILYGIWGGVLSAAYNPAGDGMGRVGALVGKAIARGLEGFDGQIERINRAWADLFVNVAQQPVG